MKTGSHRARQVRLGLGIWLLVGSWPLVRWWFKLPADAFAIWEAVALAAAILWAGRSAAELTRPESHERSDS